MSNNDLGYPLSGTKVAPQQHTIAAPRADTEQTGRSMTRQERMARRKVFLTWLRRVHGWLGLWGAVLGLLFGATGILLNHRSVMKIPLVEVAENTVTIALPNPVPASAEALGVWLQTELGYTEKQPQIKVEKARELIWNDQPVTQPESWQISFNSPGKSARADYSAGNRTVSVKHSDPNVFSFLTRLHKGSGVNAAWILLMDSIAGSLILLALSGILLWTNLRRSKLLAAGLTLGSLALAFSFGWASL